MYLPSTAQMDEAELPVLTVADDIDCLIDDFTTIGKLLNSESLAL